MKIFRILFTLIFYLSTQSVFSFAAQSVQHGELSLMGSYSKTDYGSNKYSTTRRYTASLGVNLTVVTEIEASFTNTDTFFNDDPVQTTAINEQVLSLSIVQALTPPEWIIQPYVKAGGAQYNRKQSGTIYGIPSAPTETKSPSALLGGGLRIFLLRNFSLKGEIVSYMPNLKFKDAKNNYSAQLGVGWNF